MDTKSAFKPIIRLTLVQNQVSTSVSDEKICFKLS